MCFSPRLASPLVPSRARAAGRSKKFCEHSARRRRASRALGRGSQARTRDPPCPAKPPAEGAKKIRSRPRAFRVQGNALQLTISVAPRRFFIFSLLPLGNDFNLDCRRPSGHGLKTIILEKSRLVYTNYKRNLMYRDFAFSATPDFFDFRGR